jgi:hypothetical protein
MEAYVKTEKINEILRTNLKMKHSSGMEVCINEKQYMRQKQHKKPFTLIR